MKSEHDQSNRQIHTATPDTRETRLSIVSGGRCELSIRQFVRYSAANNNARILVSAPTSRPSWLVSPPVSPLSARSSWPAWRPCASSSWPLSSPSSSVFSCDLLTSSFFYAVVFASSSDDLDAACAAVTDVVSVALCRQTVKKVKETHTRLPSVGFRSWSRFLAVSLQVTSVINPTVGCHYFPPGLQLPPHPLRGLLPILLLGEQRHIKLNGCEQFA